MAELCGKRMGEYRCPQMPREVPHRPQRSSPWIVLLSRLRVIYLYLRLHAFTEMQ